MSDLNFSHFEFWNQIKSNSKFEIYYLYLCIETYGKFFSLVDFHIDFQINKQINKYIYVLSSTYLSLNAFLLLILYLANLYKIKQKITHATKTPRMIQFILTKWFTIDVFLLLICLQIFFLNVKLFIQASFMFSSDVLNLLFSYNNLFNCLPKWKFFFSQLKHLWFFF